VRWAPLDKLDMEPIIIKHNVLLMVREQIYIENYFASATIRDKLGNDDPALHSLINTLKDYINGAILQYTRIIQDHEIGKELMYISSSNQYEQSISDSLFMNLQIKLLDIHYYAICLDKVEKLYKILLHRLSKNDHIGEKAEIIREKRKIAENMLKLVSHPLSEARNYLEHIEKEICKNNFSGFRIETNESGIKFTYGNENNKYRIDISEIEKVKNAYEALIGYIMSLPKSK
jgi:hypothetical protein